MSVLREPAERILAHWLEAADLGDGATVTEEAAALVARSADDPEIVRIATGVRGDPAHLVSRLMALSEIAADRAEAVRLVTVRLAAADSVGVLSSGPLTTEVLMALREAADEVVPVITDRSSVARGLGQVGIHPILEDPAAADRLLLPAVAVHGSRVWSSRANLDAADRATGADPTAVLVHGRPLTYLDDESRRAFRPEPWVDEATDDRWSHPYRPRPS